MKNYLLYTLKMKLKFSMNKKNNLQILNNKRWNIKWMEDWI